MTRSDPSQESVRFVWFDFHQECKNMRYDKLSKLAGMTEREVREGVSPRYFAYDLSRGEVTKRQSLVIRTNCIDCLDREDETPVRNRDECGAKCLREAAAVYGTVRRNSLRLVRVTGFCER